MFILFLQLRDLWLPLYCLWGHSALKNVSGIKAPVVNSSVESWFRTVKQFHGVGSTAGKRIKLNRFTRCQFNLVKQRLNRVQTINEREPRCPPKRVYANRRKIRDYRPAHDKRGDQWRKNRRAPKGYFTNKGIFKKQLVCLR